MGLYSLSKHMHVDTNYIFNSKYQTRLFVTISFIV
jgi:hypothetical protein